jgi:RIO kinase 1
MDSQNVTEYFRRSGGVTTMTPRELFDFVVHAGLPTPAEEDAYVAAALERAATAAPASEAAAAAAEVDHAVFMATDIPRSLAEVRDVEGDAERLRRGDTEGIYYTALTGVGAAPLAAAAGAGATSAPEAAAASAGAARPRRGSRCASKMQVNEVADAAADADAVPLSGGGGAAPVVTGWAATLQVGGGGGGGKRQQHRRAHDAVTVEAAEIDDSVERTAAGVVAGTAKAPERAVAMDQDGEDAGESGGPDSDDSGSGSSSDEGSDDSDDENTGGGGDDGAGAPHPSDPAYVKKGASKEERRAHKAAVKEANRERRKEKLPKGVKRRAVAKSKRR